jgi:hypothetical protein
MRFFHETSPFTPFDAAERRHIGRLRALFRKRFGLRPEDMRVMRLWTRARHGYRTRADLEMDAMVAFLCVRRELDIDAAKYTLHRAIAETADPADPTRLAIPFHEYDIDGNHIDELDMFGNVIASDGEDWPEPENPPQPPTWVFIGDLGPPPRKS